MKKIKRLDPYPFFDKIEELMKLKKINTGKVIDDYDIEQYGKLVQKGKCSHFDYNFGFFFVTIKTNHVHYKKLFHTRVYYHTIDDGCLGGWSIQDNLKKTLKRTQNIANVYRDIIVLPTDKEMNSKLIQYGIQLYPE